MLNLSYLWFLLFAEFLSQSIFDPQQYVKPPDENAGHSAFHFLSLRLNLDILSELLGFTNLRTDPILY